MIASNYRKFPEAMALQLVLMFGRCTWHTTRPTQRVARAVRAARGALVKATPQIVQWAKKATPDWFKLAKRAARELANQVKAAMACFVWDAEPPAKSFQEETDPLAILKAEAAKMHREYLTVYDPISSLIARPSWGQRWKHSIFGTIHFINRYGGYRD